MIYQSDVSDVFNFVLRILQHEFGTLGFSF